MIFTMKLPILFIYRCFVLGIQENFPKNFLNLRNLFFLFFKTCDLSQSRSNSLLFSVICVWTYSDTLTFSVNSAWTGSVTLTCSVHSVWTGSDSIIFSVNCMWIGFSSIDVKRISAFIEYGSHSKMVGKYPTFGNFRIFGWWVDDLYLKQRYKVLHFFSYYVLL